MRNIIQGVLHSNVVVLEWSREPRRLCVATQRRREFVSNKVARASREGWKMDEIECIMQQRGDGIPAHLFHIFKSLEKKHLKKKRD